MTRDFFVDIHAHPTLRAYNSVFTEGQRNIWEKTHNPTFDTVLGRWVRMQSREVASSSQANLYNYAAGNTRIVFDALYPFEKGFLNVRKLPRAMFGKENTEMLLQTVTGFEAHQLQSLRKSKSYFQELLGQYAFLAKGQGSSPCGKYSYQLARNWSDAKAITESDPNKIAVVVTIEGAHALNCGLPGKQSANEKEVLENIGTIKSWRSVPLFMNLAHHFYNELCGHTRSLKPGVSRMLNQRRGMGEGITALGWKVLHELLAVDNGKRILIDIKHMSLQARKEYYKMLESLNRLTRNDRVPIVCSHTGLSAFKNIKAGGRKPDKPRKMRSSDFHNWSINISDEEIKLISDSGGIIGLMVDKGILGSNVRLAAIKEMSDVQARKDALLELLAQNIIHAVTVAGGPQGWDLLALGTDYDGVITHLDPYHEASTLPDLQSDLIDFFKRTQYGRTHWHGLEPEEMVRKLMQTNAMNFLERYF